VEVTEIAEPEFWDWDRSERLFRGTIQRQNIRATALARRPAPPKIFYASRLISHGAEPEFGLG